MTNCPHEPEDVEVIATDVDMASIGGIVLALTSILEYAPDTLQVVTALGAVSSAALRSCPAEQRREVTEAYLDLIRRQVEQSLAH